MAVKCNSPLHSVHEGYSDEILESLSRLQYRFERGFAPWVHWESENSSFGKTLRKWAFYPAFLPIYASSDHGVHWESRCWPNEVEAKSEVFFTWNKKKNFLMNRDHGKNSYHIPHPWVHYRKNYFEQPSLESLGTLVFFAHSNRTTTPVYSDLDKYINDLKSLPSKFQPIVLCLSFQDIEKGLHKTLRKYELPLVTAGTTQSKDFVDRFYSLIYRFRYASSSNIGSHTYYILEAGIPFFLFGPYPEYYIQGSNAVQDGKQDLNDYGDEEDLNEFSKFKRLLSEPSDKVSQEQYAIASKYLGMNSQISRIDASIILWRQLFLHFGELLEIYARAMLRPFWRYLKRIIKT